MNCAATILTSDKERKKLQKETMDKTGYLFCVCIASVVTDKFGFDKNETYKLINQIWDRFDSLKREDINLKDLTDTLLKEYDISIEWR